MVAIGEYFLATLKITTASSSPGRGNKGEGDGCQGLTA